MSPELYVKPLLTCRPPRTLQRATRTARDAGFGADSKVFISKHAVQVEDLGASGKAPEAKNMKMFSDLLAMTRCMCVSSRAGGASDAGAKAYPAQVVLWNRLVYPL